MLYQMRVTAVPPIDGISKFNDHGISCTSNFIIEVNLSLIKFHSGEGYI